MAREQAKDIDMTTEVWAAEEGGFWSHHPATGTVSQGKTMQQALEGLDEAVDSAPKISAMEHPFAFKDLEYFREEVAELGNSHDLTLVSE